ncbi:MAG TPA: nucleotidyltransferase domain-containing protein [bacterium]|nr:nucleotidyltransferase domain-containing protein [bacterium]HQJ60941.1 nucleotidyltransferase domain-containing protein [bacterium]
MAPVPNEIVEIILSLRKKLSSAIKIKRIILFGSYAKGCHNKNSDIDICIVAGQVKNRALEMLKIAPETALIDTRLETVVVSEEDYLNENFGIIGEIKRTGIEII